MAPKLTDGDFVIASQLYFTLNVGDLVVVEHPIYQRIIKRVAAIENNNLQLTGENNASVSTASMGWLATTSVKGKVFYSVRKPKR